MIFIPSPTLASAWGGPVDCIGGTVDHFGPVVTLATHQRPSLPEPSWLMLMVYPPTHHPRGREVQAKRRAVGSGGWAGRWDVGIPSVEF